MSAQCVLAAGWLERESYVAEPLHGKPAQALPHVVLKGDKLAIEKVVARVDDKALIFVLTVEPHCATRAFHTRCLAM